MSAAGLHSGASRRGRAIARPASGAGKRSGGGFPRAGESQAWVGIDVSNEPVRPAPRGLYPLLALAVVVALGVAAVRIDLLRTRYAVAAATERESKLREEQRQLLVHRRQLRDPVELAEKARARGFRPPSHVVSIPDPTAGTLEPIVVPRPVPGEPDIAAISGAVAGDGPRAGSEWR